MKLHEHPQKQAYGSPAEWPVFSLQGHWPMADPTMTPHIHVDVQFPYGAEIAAEPFVCPFTLKAFMFDGTITEFSGDSFAGIVWDETGTSTPPVMHGDPASMIPRQWTGRVTINPQKGRFAHKHGWTGVPFLARSLFASGEVFDVKAFHSFFSVFDTTDPEALPPGNFGPVLSSRVDIAPKSGIKFGTMVMEVESWVPLLPIDKPWPLVVSFYNYATATDDPLSDGRFEQRHDVNFHAGVLGGLTDSAIANKQGQTRDVVLDPAVMGSGAHNVVELWRQQIGGESVASLVVFNVTVGAGVPLPVKVTVPSVVGQAKAAAASALMAAGLMLGSEVDASDPLLPAGAVIAQFPAAGTLVLAGSTVNLTISTGAVMTPTAVWVPAVPTFMQLVVDGVPQDRWKICDPAEPMNADHCPELVTKPIA